MANIYIALNGDGVGERIGNAIAQDDHESLASASSSIENAHVNIDKWVESIGGQKVSRSGDDGIYIIPQKALGKLEEIRDSYKDQSGHSLTIGIGESMSQASKALIYGKMSGKDQIVHYEPTIDDYLADVDSEDSEVPEDVALDDGQEEAPEEGEAAPKSTVNEEDESGEDDDSSALPPKKSSSLPADKDEDEDEEDESEEGEDKDEDEGLKPGEDIVDDGANDDQTQSESPVQEPPSKKGDISEKEDPKDPDAPGSRAIDGDVDGKDFGADKDDSDEEESEEEMGSKEPLEEGDEEVEDEGGEEPPIPSEKPMPSSGQSVYQELNEDDVENPNMDMGNESYEQAGDDDALSSMIHGDMEAGDDESLGEDQLQESTLDDELKQDITSALLAFKENKDMLEQAREQNPKLYQATITMLRSMIEMAKKLGASPDKDMQAQESEQELNEEFPEAEQPEQEESPEASPQEQMKMPGDLAPKKK